MFVVRDVLHCRPGKVRPMIEKFRIMARVIKEMGNESPRVLTDASGEQFWTVVIEVEVANIADFFAMEQSVMANAAAREAMADYHELVDTGQRQIYRIEG
jgi:hypothetical protein